MCSPKEEARHVTLNSRTPVTSGGKDRQIWNLCLHQGWLVAWWNSAFSDWKSYSDAFREQRAPHSGPTARRVPGGGRGRGIHPQADWWFSPTGAGVHRGSGPPHQWRSGTSMLNYSWGHFIISQNFQVPTSQEAWKTQGQSLGIDQVWSRSYTCISYQVWNSLVFIIHLWPDEKGQITKHLGWKYLSGTISENICGGIHY